KECTMNILNQYIKLVEFLGITLGPDYEIVLHDVREKENSIIAIANGHITGRGIGSPISQKCLNLINNKDYLERDFDTNFNSVSNNTNKLLRSSILYIKDNNELIGLLCMNFNDSKYMAISKEIMELCHPHELIGKNNFEAVDEIMPALDDNTNFENHNIHNLARITIETILQKIQIPPERLTKDEKLEIVRELNHKGLFRLKESVQIVAELLHCSEATIYRYLSSLKKIEDVN
ncbi:MAG: PAS domain-containing protein, partial [Tissierellia bacterium]|nr:PAS domain-containing protein [Tissierellia bacterium]